MPLAPSILRRQAGLAVQIVRDISAAVSGGTPADAALARFYRDHPEFGSRDRRLFSQVVFSYFRWKGWLGPAAAPDLETACVLAHALEAEEINPAIAWLAESTKRFESGVTPLGRLPPMEKPAGLALMTGGAAPVLTDVVPAWCSGTLHVPPGAPANEHLLRLVSAFQTPPPTWLRARPGCRDRVIEILPLPSGERAGVRVSSLLPDAISIPRGLNLRALAPQLRGLAEIQDLASQAVGLVCAPSPGAYWWDACCGSGGKALHLADLMRGEGRLLATDVRTGILDEMARRLRESRCGGVEARRWDGITPPDTMFDGVLVDAPCSGLGTWHRNPDARWRMTLDEVKRLAGVQLDLLRLCAGRVKPGGALVYATCTLTSLENQTVTDLFLAETPSFEPAPFVNPLNGSPCDGQVWVYPWEADCNGMFIARFVRRTGDGNR